MRYIEVSVLDGGRGGSGVAHLHRLGLQWKPVQTLDGFFGIFCVEVIHKGVAEAHMAELVFDELTVLNFAHGGEKVLDFVFAHRVREVVHNQVGLGFAFGTLWPWIADRAEDRHGRHFFTANR